MKQSNALGGDTQITFDFGNNLVVGDFDGGDICVDGGIVILRELDNQRGYSKRIASCISDWRTGAVKHDLEELVRQQLYMKASGYSAGSDANVLRSDSMFQLAVSSMGRELAGQSTVSRFENSVDVESIRRMQDLLPRLFLSRYKKAPRKVVLNMDSTCDPVYGTQQMSFWNGFYHEYCYTHLYLLSDDGYPLAGVARAGNAGTAEGGLPMLARIVSELRSARKRMAIEYRADSAFLNFQTLDWCEQNKVTYYIGLAPNNALNVLAKDLVRKAYEQYIALFGKPAALHGRSWRQKEEKIRFASKEEGRMQELFERQQRVRVYGEIRYAARTWSRERRVIVRVDYTKEGEDVRFVVTNCESGTARRVYEDKYCQRARCEMHIKELKSQHCDRLSCHEWLANQLRLTIHLFAYAMQIELRQTLPVSERSVSTTALRSRFLKIAAQVKVTTRVTRIRWSTSHLYQDEFRRLLTRLRNTA